MFHARGAHPWRVKLQTLAMEVDRRMNNMDAFTTRKERVGVLAKFVQKLKDSEYDVATRTEILEAGLKRYYRRVAEDITGNVPLHRSPTDLVETQRLKPMKVSTWFDMRRRGGQHRER